VWKRFGLESGGQNTAILEGLDMTQVVVRRACCLPNKDLDAKGPDREAPGHVSLVVVLGPSPRLEKKIEHAEDAPEVFAQPSDARRAAL
jgi:hypothetical protein